VTGSTNVPPSRREDVVDDYHGTPVADPYRWLEAGDAAEVTDWVARQNALTRGVLDDPAGLGADRAVWHGRLVDLMQLPVVMGAVRRDDTLFTWERPSGSEQFVLARRSAVDATLAPVTLVDPASRSADAATAIDWFEPSDDGGLVAIGTSEGGTENSTLRIVSGSDGSSAGTPGADEIPNTRACSVAWEPDGAGFFYTRYPEGDQYHRTVHHHRLGAAWADDPVVWAEHPDPQAWPSVDLSPDGRWLVVSVSVGWSRTDVHVLDRSTDQWTTVVAGVEANTYLGFSADASALVGTTTIDAPRNRVVRITLDSETLGAGPESWETLVTERDDVIGAVRSTAAGLVMVTSRAAVDSVWRLDHDGVPLADRPIDLGGIVTVDGVTVSRRHDDFFVLANSFTAPPSLRRWTPDGSVVTWAPDVPDASLVPDLVVSQTTYPSRDGTEIGLFLIHRADVEPNPETPTILNGYGGFAISLGPAWQPRIAAWCAAGGVYAVAGLRGGLEHGEAWHEAGKGPNKQNVFDDFHAAADTLVHRGVTSREHLAVYGGSNGGLLMGVVLTQRPDLCAAVLCAVPLLDMVRFPKFLIARLWTSEYGDPDVAEEFGWIFPYSPYHHVTPGTEYPATLIQTAEGDTRVDPLHARKMTALLQWASPALDRRPILLFQEDRAGHGVGKPVAKQADSIADGLAFLGAHTGLHP
jgi:prolyl oligopeptidase